MKYSPGYDTEKRTVFELRSKLSYKLQKLFYKYLMRESLPELKDQLILGDHLLRTTAARKAKKKADRVTKQLALASMEAACKKPGKYAIIPRPDPDEFRR